MNHLEFNNKIKELRQETRAKEKELTAEFFNSLPKLWVSNSPLANLKGWELSYVTEKKAEFKSLDVPGQLWSMDIADITNHLHPSDAYRPGFPSPSSIEAYVKASEKLFSEGDFNLVTVSVVDFAGKTHKVRSIKQDV